MKILYDEDKDAFLTSLCVYSHTHIVFSGVNSNPPKWNLSAKIEHDFCLVSVHHLSQSLCNVRNTELKKKQI